VSRWLLRLGSYAQVAMFDKRGTGLSDRVAEFPGLDQRIDDVRAVMDAAAGMEQAALLGISEGGAMCALFAATYPVAAARWSSAMLIRHRHLLSRRWSKILTISNIVGEAVTASESLHPPARTTRRSSAGGAGTSECRIALLVPPRTRA
jgi:pimeloyl-ACP methyl ester carboxylesterase